MKKMPFQKEVQIENLKKALDKALKIDEENIADQIKTSGFRCKKCSQCCRAEFGDNTVMVFPSEIRTICNKTGLFREDFVIPTPSQDRDAEGNIHTFEWILKKNIDCIFLKNDLCEIYDSRPYICRTYPFYLLDGKLEVSECIGLSEYINDGESLKLAALLKDRYIEELNESISLLERFEGFIPGCNGNVCVHDSEGEHWLNHIISSNKTLKSDVYVIVK